MRTYEVLVLGGGSAGTAAAAAAQAAGRQVALFNRGELGGLCILRGCMPTKTMLHAAHLAHGAAHHHTPGIGHAIPSIDFARVMENKRDKVQRFQKAKIESVEATGYEVIDAYARFDGPDTVLATFPDQSTETYRFTHGAVLATGSDPIMPPIDGIEDVPVWSSDDVMNLTEAPSSAIVLGSGAIGLELAVFLARMGTRTVLASRRRVFSKIDSLLSDEMECILKEEPNLHLVSPFEATRIELVEDLVHFRIQTATGPETLVAPHFLAATGRRARLEGMGLEAAHVQFENGEVRHDECMRTSNDRIFVAGDATGSAQLLHVANWEGKAAGLGAAGVHGEHPVERRLAMSVIFTDPPLASVGMTESEAKAAGISVETASAKFAQTGRAITLDVQHGVWKLVVRKDDGEILGSQILGPRADDIAHVISTAMYYRGTVHDLLKMPWYHPTVTEVLLSLARELAVKTA
ncbi:MAG: FAD-dependent oxidoreductase [Planctomycetota bacterium]|nr:FAD-dependent oxidoreductase [Planctomycetota bacterium]